MPSRTIALAVCLLVFAPTRVPAQTVRLAVDESATRASLGDGFVDLALAVRNGSGAGVDARVRAEVLEPSDDVVASAEVAATLPSGSHAARLRLANAGRLVTLDVDDAVRLRVRYRVAPSDGPPVEGIVALSEIAPDAFVLALVAPEYAAPGTRALVRAFARRPSSGLPVEGVTLVATRRTGGSNPPTTMTAVTDSRGSAVFAVDTPSGDGEDVKVDVQGRLGGFATSADVEIEEDDDRGTIVVGTDKPLYQPGQTLHVRALAFDDRRRARADAELTFTISDPENENVFEETATTDRFGVASVDWTIPETLKLGSFFVRVDADETSASGGADVEISRYELPTFAVAVEPDRPYYLLGERADVTVRADYLFGKPVATGHVRVVRESRRSWDYERQTWDVDEEATYEGDVDGSGRFVAHVDLGDEGRNLAENDYLRFSDVGYTAYFTDATTNRTERRRFDLRLTKDPIHVYVLVPDSRAGRRSSDVFVAASYADGAPAQCRVRAFARTSGDGAGASPDREVASGRTNRFGVAKLADVPIEPDDDNMRSASLRIEASDASGRTGRHEETLWLPRSAYVRVATEKAVYLPGEPVTVRVESSEPSDAVAIVEMRRGADVVDSKVVRLDRGAGRAWFPYRPDFRGRLSVVAYRPAARSDWYNGAATSVRQIVYPADDELRVTVGGARPKYRPGDAVRADMRIRDAAGEPVEGVLGVVVYDRAVDERARSGGEFGYVPPGFFGGYDDLSNATSSLPGLSARDLDRIDTTRPVPPDVQLAADVLLQSSEEYVRTSVAESAASRPEYASIFDPIMRSRTAGLVHAIESAQLGRASEAELVRALAATDVSATTPSDPWGTPLRYGVTVQGAELDVALLSAGPDKRPETGDDYAVARIRRPYFAIAGAAVSRACLAFADRTGRAVASEADLAAAIAAAGVPDGELLDPWGHPYRHTLSVQSASRIVDFVSAGPDGRAATRDDVYAGRCTIDYFGPTRERIGAVLDDRALVPDFPRDETALRRALAAHGVDLPTERDPWGNAFFATFERDDTYGAGTASTVVVRYGETDGGKLVTQMKAEGADTIRVVSPGPDRVRGTSDDVRVALFVRSRTPSAENPPRKTVDGPSAPVRLGATGAIGGTVRDANGDVIPTATVTVTDDNGVIGVAHTSNEGEFRFVGLRAGLYTVKIDAANFKSSIYTEVPVRSSALTPLDVALEAGAITETVTVTASSEALVSTSSESATTSVSRGVRWTGRAAQAIATPRVRSYFPETLLWRPSLETDGRGRARLDFTLADSITSWRLNVFASTADGRVGRATADITAFQPFFVEHDPPPVLTIGDRVDLPVVVRNYLDTPEKVAVDMRPDSRFAIEGATRRDVAVPAGESGAAIFSVRALAAGEGAQRVSASGASASDAVERRVAVRPEGDERTATASSFLAGGGSIELDVPDDAIAVTSAELRLYPSLLAHAVESVEAILERPHGCGEQTTSSTYPSVMVLAAASRGGVRLAPSVEALARRYAADGVRRLMNYRSADGGFSYWADGRTDLALTAYVLRFLTDARRVTAVDDAAIAGARDYLLAAQRSDGGWGAAGATDSVTAYVAASLARSDAGERTVAAVGRALDLLRATPAASDDAYAVAAGALAASAVGRREEAATLAARLGQLAHAEPSGASWEPGAQTPFHGWGRAGVFETTATAVLALHEIGNEALAGRGLSFLLRNEDGSGTWKTTQATVVVLDAIVALAPSTSEAGDARASYDVRVDGAPVPLVRGSDTGFDGPITVDLAGRIGPGRHTIDVRHAGSEQAAMASLAATYYAPWDAESASRDGRAERKTSGLRLAVAYDRTRATATEEIACSVEVSRDVYGGMLLAEIGLPPGAEVDRASLDRAKEASDWAFSGYDVLPDRVVLYLWPWTAAPTKIRFTFRPRYGMSALAAPSTLADYYNPDARVALAPPRFEVAPK